MTDEEWLKQRNLLAALMVKNDTSKTLLGSIGKPSALPVTSNALLDYSNYISGKTAQNKLAGIGALAAAVQQQRSPAQTIWPHLPTATPKPALPVVPVKRKAFFSFHYADIMRVNNVRNEGKISKRSNERNFYDRSLWESKQLEGDEALKRLIREGMQGASAVCVLIGTQTHGRRWCRYEIARAIVDQRGLFGVHINGLRHHVTKQADELGFNPFHHMGLYKQNDGKIYLCEKKWTFNPGTGKYEWQWHYYADYNKAVPHPKYMTPLPQGIVVALSTAVDVYDYCDPQKNLGAWVDHAANRAGK